jgi:hypothetical protein
MKISSKISLIAYNKLNKKACHKSSAKLPIVNLENMKVNFHQTSPQENEGKKRECDLRIRHLVSENAV